MSLDIKNYHIFQINHSIINTPVTKFCQIYKEILLEGYKIFPVPQRFLESILDFVSNSNSLQENLYLFKDIVQKYTKNWRYYQVFRFNSERMIKKNISSSIKVITYKSNSDIITIKNKYRPNIKDLKFSLNTKAIIYDYTDNFDLVLAINKNINSQFQLNKVIQHELIHWMQVVLNAESYTTRGIFNDISNSVTSQQIIFLSDAFENTREINNTINYVLSNLEFQPWCANAIQDFEYLNLDLNKFKSIIENNDLFVSTCKKFKNNEKMMELLLFSKICYFTSVNNPADDRYWYLIEAIKENK